MTSAPNRAECRRLKAQLRSGAKAVARTSGRHLNGVHTVRAGAPPPSTRVVGAIATWFNQNRQHTVCCGDCDLVFDGSGPHSQAFVFVLPVLDPSADGAGIAFCGGCARQTDDELEAAAVAMHGAGSVLVRRLPADAGHAAGGRA